MSKFVHDADADDDDNINAKAIAIPRVYSENSRAKNCSELWTLGSINRFIPYSVEANFLSGVFPLLTSAEACKKSSRWLLNESCISAGVGKPVNTCASPTTMI